MVDVLGKAGRLLFEVEATSDAFHSCDWLSVKWSLCTRNSFSSQEQLFSIVDSQPRQKLWSMDNELMMPLIRDAISNAFRI